MKSNGIAFHRTAFLSTRAKVVILKALPACRQAGAVPHLCASEGRAE